MGDILQELGSKYSLEELEKRRIHFIAEIMLKKLSEYEYNLLILFLTDNSKYIESRKLSDLENYIDCNGLKTFAPVAKVSKTLSEFYFRTASMVGELELLAALMYTKLPIMQEIDCSYEQVYSSDDYDGFDEILDVKLKKATKS